ncbi:MAG: hypothetical protein AAGM22_06385, partial [Acidobacteriota bacterium]
DPKALLETRGEMSSDYSIDIEWISGMTLKRGSVNPSPSAAPIILRSNQGNIRLLRRIEDRLEAPFETEGESLEKR